MNEENKNPLTGEPLGSEPLCTEPSAPAQDPDFDSNCQFLEDIQKKPVEEAQTEEFVDLERPVSNALPSQPKTRLARLAEKEMRRQNRAKRYDEQRFSKIRTTVYQMVEVGFNETGLTRGYDVLSFILIILNVLAGILFTFDWWELHYTPYLKFVESVTVAFFAFDYVLRLWTAPLLYPQERAPKAVVKYIFSFWGIIDLVSFLPFYLPFFFPRGSTVFRLFRVMRLFRLFRINAYYDSFGTITAVLKGKKQQLVSSIFIILVLMVASSLLMYSVEHDAQPDVFKNALSGIWWASSALLTVGYGDVYPITVAGKIIGMLITFLGVGMVAIPTGIISAGFVEQYQRFKEMDEETAEIDFHFIKVQLNYKDDWVGKRIMDLNLPHNVVVAVIQRGNSTIVPRGNVVLEERDTLVLGAESTHDKEWDLELKEIILKRKHPWNGQYIRDLDISRQTFIVLIRRKNRSMVPNGNVMLREGDVVVLYSKKHIQDAIDIDL